MDNVLYGLLLSCLVYLRFNRGKKNILCWSTLVVVLFLLFKGKTENYANREALVIEYMTGGETFRDKLATFGDSPNVNNTPNLKDYLGETGAKVIVDLAESSTPEGGFTPGSPFNVTLIVPETLAFEVLTTEECRQRCEAIQAKPFFPLYMNDSSEADLITLTEDGRLDIGNRSERSEHVGGGVIGAAVNVGGALEGDVCDCGPNSSVSGGGSDGSGANDSGLDGCGPHCVASAWAKCGVPRVDVLSPGVTLESGVNQVEYPNQKFIDLRFSETAPETEATAIPTNLCWNNNCALQYSDVQADGPNFTDLESLTSDEVGLGDGDKLQQRPVSADETAAFNTPEGQSAASPARVAELAADAGAEINQRHELRSQSCLNIDPTQQTGINLQEEPLRIQDGEGIDWNLTPTIPAGVDQSTWAVHNTGEMAADNVEHTRYRAIMKSRYFMPKCEVGGVVRTAELISPDRLNDVLSDPDGFIPGHNRGGDEPYPEGTIPGKYIFEYTITPPQCDEGVPDPITLTFPQALFSDQSSSIEIIASPTAECTGPELPCDTLPLNQYLKIDKHGVVTCHNCPDGKHRSYMKDTPVLNQGAIQKAIDHGSVSMHAREGCMDDHDPGTDPVQCEPGQYYDGADCVSCSNVAEGRQVISGISPPSAQQGEQQDAETVCPFICREDQYVAYSDDENGQCSPCPDGKVNQYYNDDQDKTGTVHDPTITKSDRDIDPGNLGKHNINYAGQPIIDPTTREPKNEEQCVDPNCPTQIGRCSAGGAGCIRNSRGASSFKCSACPTGGQPPTGAPINLATGENVTERECDRDCVGTWGACDKDCTKSFTLGKCTDANGASTGHTTQVTCEAVDGNKWDSGGATGDGNCPELTESPAKCVPGEGGSDGCPEEDQPYCAPNDTLVAVAIGTGIFSVILAVFFWVEDTRGKGTLAADAEEWFGGAFGGPAIWPSTVQAGGAHTPWRQAQAAYCGPIFALALILWWVSCGSETSSHKCDHPYRDCDDSKKCHGKYCIPEDGCFDASGNETDESTKETCEAANNQWLTAYSKWEKVGWTIFLWGIYSAVMLLVVFQRVTDWRWKGVWAAGLAIVMSVIGYLIMRENGENDSTLLDLTSSEE